MSYANEILFYNINEYYVDEVRDFEQLTKWDFFKFDEFNIANFVDAENRELISEKDLSMLREHRTSILTEVLDAASIYSIALNKCYERKKILDELDFNLSKYDFVLKGIDELIHSYEEAVQLVENDIAFAKQRKDLPYTDNSVIDAVGQNLNKTHQNRIQSNVPLFHSCRQEIENLEKMKEEISGYRETLREGIEESKTRLNQEMEINEKAKGKMYENQELFRRSVTYYNRLGFDTSGSA